MNVKFDLIRSVFNERHLCSKSNDVLEEMKRELLREAEIKDNIFLDELFTLKKKHEIEAVL